MFNIDMVSFNDHVSDINYYYYKIKAILWGTKYFPFFQIILKNLRKLTDKPLLKFKQQFFSKTQIYKTIILIFL